MSLKQRLLPLWALSASRVTQFWREPGAVFWTFGFPLLITVALGSAFRDQSPPPSRVAIVAGGGIAAVAEAVGGQRGLAVETDDAATAARRLRSGEVLLVIEAPAAGPVVYRFDPTRPDAPAARRVIDDAVQRRAGRRDPVAARDETAVARGARYVDWLIPGLLGMQLLNGAMWGAAF